MTDAAGFALDPRLAGDSTSVGRLGLCHVRLMDDRRFPWLLLVPGRAGIVEWHDLTDAEAATLAAEVRRVSKTVAEAFRPVKVNVAALGNNVRQFHVHVIARSEGDAAWPNPVWGCGVAEPYAEEERGRLIADLRRRLGPMG